ncbi:unnamed protein product [Brassica rapa]|uniref:Uncharacterized protein n=2 Tax=Brassica TaxID=3705 RepID=A0A3P5ZS92_BRACM|nr:unnamed protein product [Brassica napus]CAG7888001.1 unnamed protein product [Brassica rapa]VDC75471.1 unnamed protein product [Brassica rapa]
MCQLRRSHGKDTWDHTPNRTHFRATLIIFGNALHDVGSSNFHQTAMTGCLAGSATSIWEVIEFRAIYYLTVEEMKRYGAKRGGHTCASLSYDSESSVELRAPRPFHVKVVTLEPTCF